MRFNLAVSALFVASAVAAPAPQPGDESRAVADAIHLAIKRANVPDSAEKRACDWPGFQDCADICYGMCPIGAPPGCNLGVGVCIANCGSIYGC